MKHPTHRQPNRERRRISAPPIVELPTLRHNRHNHNRHQH
jgi:hypothetical protein